MTGVAVWSEGLLDPTLGRVRVWATETGIRRIDFEHDGTAPQPGETLSDGPPPSHLLDALTQLREYLAGRLRVFDLPLDLTHATPFQHKVYDRLLRIPYGHIVTYGEVARDIGAEAGTARAVGGAVGANPIAIVVPCHRVVAADGKLVGFGGGLPRKAALLRLEGIEVDGVKPSSRVRPEVLRLPL